ncbi:hypothetical protein [Streptomyces sp. NPDC058291]|jgi:hypothetical protein|uniref:hypothetical protein n=1 Tax=Streptomyces sp. NPDC058291 TaxID=3346427 RepID=UPI0036E973A7
MRTARTEAREALRADLPAAHLGLGLVTVASTGAGFVGHPAVGAGIGGASAALFLLALSVMYLRGKRGTDALRPAYLFTFGWASWL